MESEQAKVAREMDGIMETTEPVVKLPEEAESKSDLANDAAPTGSSMADSRDDDDKYDVESDAKAILDPMDTASTPDPASVGSTTAATASSESTDRAWDTTDRKVVVHNVLKFVRPKEVQRMIDQWLKDTDLRVVKHKKPPKDGWVQLTLESVDMVGRFIDHMEQKRFTNRKGGVLTAKRSDSRSDAAERKEHNGKRGRDDDTQPDGKRMKHEQSMLPKTDDQVRDAITPLWRLTYPKQLERKERDMIHSCAKKIIKELKKKFRTLEKEARNNENRKVVPMYDWISEQRPIDVETILPSPRVTEYRNKCEFNFGYFHEIEANGTDEMLQTKSSEDVKNKTPAVGFMASGWSGGVSRPHCCQNVPPEACAIADIVNEFLASSPLPPYSSREHRGFWRTLMIRTSERLKECMLVFMHAPATGGLGAKDTTDDLSAIFDAEKERLVSMLVGRELPLVERQFPIVEEESGDQEKPPEAIGVTQTCSMRVTSIFFQEFEGISMPDPEHPVQHVYGKQVLRERLGKCTFQVSPGAFFQVNTDGAEVLYSDVVKRVREVSPNPEETLLFDVCCGTGTIGLTCLKEGVVGRVVGVDISEPAIEDAKVNAGLNGHANDTDTVHFIASRAEHVLAKEIAKVKDSSPSVVAVVDPAREGLHPDVIRTLRVNGGIQRVVYVSCNPTGSLVRDAGLLCAPPTKKYAGVPFRPTSARPVDMFPLTPHCELVMTFDRLGS